MALSNLISSFYMATVKYSIVEHQLDVIDLCLFRTATILVSSAAIALFLGVSFKVYKSSHKALWLRSIIGTLGFTAFVYGIKYLPLGIHTILFNTAPFQASLFGWFLLKEKPSMSELVCMCICFTGVVIIGLAKPISSSTEEGVQYTDPSTRLIGTVCSLTVSACYALISVLTRQMQNIHFSIVLFYYSVLGVVVLAIWLVGETLYLGQPLRILN